MIDVLLVVDELLPYGGGELFLEDLISNLKHCRFSAIHVTTGRNNYRSRIDIPNYCDGMKYDIVMWWGRILDSITKFHGPKLLVAHSSFNPMWYLETAIEHTDYAIAVSEDTASEIAFNPCKVVYPGINFDMMPDANPSLKGLLGFNDTDFVVGSFARLDKVKNIPLLIKAISKTTAKLLLVGNGKEQTDILRLCNTLIPNKFIYVSGIHPRKIGSFYSAIDAFCLSSVSEGCPRVMWETMYYSKPFIGTPVGAIPNVINGTNGVIAENEEEITNAINNLQYSPELCAKIGLNGKQTVIEKGNAIETASKIDAYIKCILNKELL